MEIIFFIIFIWILTKAANTNSQTLETILRNRNFKNIQRVKKYDCYGGFGRIFIIAYSNSMQYLFVKNMTNIPITVMSHEELKLIQEVSKKLNCDRIILYVAQTTIPIELTKITALYNVEIWNKNGESNFSSYRVTKANTTSSRLAKTLKPENAIYEHKKNGVIAKDTCHIAPTTSPIQEHPTTFFKKKGPQRL